MVARRLSQWFETVADGGRELLRLRTSGERGPGALASDLLSTKGDAIGAALASDVVRAWLNADPVDKLELLRQLIDGRDADVEAARAAWRAFEEAPGPDAARSVCDALESDRIRLFRRIAMAQDGVRALVDMRAVALAGAASSPVFEAAAGDLERLFNEWFNPGFLTLEVIDWNSPAALLEKLIRYEAVNAIQSWRDLRRRLGPDRRCFAFFHPTLPDEPLIFVAVALCKGLAKDLAPLLDPDAPTLDPAAADTAIFYSISNCQAGLERVRLGNFLIKHVAALLAAELPNIGVFATLSPLPQFRAWLEQARERDDEPALDEKSRAALEQLDAWTAEQSGSPAKPNAQALERLAARYLLHAKRRGRPLDPVARFHLGNGARLERINPNGDPTPAGARRSYGVLVNYLYDLDAVEKNHQLYVEQREVICSPAVRKLAG